MSELPKGWVKSTIGDSIFLNEKHIGLMDEMECGFVPMALVPTGYGEPVAYEVRTWGQCKKGFTQFRDNDVILAKITPCFENGKGALVTGLPNGIGAGSTEYFVLRTVENLVVPKYIHAFVKTKDFLVNCETNMSGSVGHRRVPKDYLLNYPFPLAPLAEQKRIVAKLDEVLAQVDTIKARLDRIPAILKRFRQSVLAAAVSGKLTEEWRIGNYSEAWKALSIGDISTVATGKTPKRTNSEYWNAEDVPWLTSSATGNLFCYEAEQYVSHFAAEDCKLKLFPIGTLLLAMYGEGKTRGQVTELMFEATCNQACAAIMVDESKALKSYVKLRLLENYEETRKAAAGGNQPNLNLNKVREIAISLPSKNEQTEIVRLVDQYFAFVDTIEAQVKKAQARVDNLTQSILAKAFRGELVAQDPNDEPAEKLLERIAQARKEAEALAKVAKKTEKQAVKQG